MSNLDQSPIMQLAADGKAEDLREELRSKCFEPDGGLYYFTKVVLGYKDLVPSFHLEFANHIQGSVTDLKRGYLEPRGHFKSTIVSKAYPLWRLVGGGKSIEQADPRNLRILIVGESDTVGSKNLNDPKWHVQNNQLLKWLFPEIIPSDYGKIRWQDTLIDLPRSKSFDEGTITTIGVGAKHTGFHYDIIIYDDIIGEKAAKSDAMMEEAKHWFSLAPGLLNDQRTSEELIIGTRWRHGKGDLYGYIMEEMPFNADEGRPFGFKWHVRSAINKDGTPAFPERFTIEVLEDIRRREKEYKFSCQYLNKPTAPEGTAFKDEQLKSFKIGEDEHGVRNLLIPGDGSSPIKLQQLARISFYDPSSGGKKADCENAVIVLGTAPDKRKFVLDAWSANCGFRQAIEKWFQLNDKFVCWPNYYEAVGAHKEVGEIINERKHLPFCPLCKQLTGKEIKHRRLSPVPILPPGGSSAPSKTDRILTFAQADIEDGLVYLRDGLFALRTQILSFPYGELVDQFDALAYCIWKGMAPPAADELKSIEIEQKQKLQDRVQRTAQQYEVGGYV